MIRTKSNEPYHISGHLHVTGASKFIGDDIKPSNMHYAKILASCFAHAKILKIDTTEAENMPGVIAVITYKDIPGENQVGHAIKDQPLLPVDEVTYFGQPVAVVVAQTSWFAEKAVKQIKVDYEELTPVFTIKEAIEKKAFYIPERCVENGNIEEGFRQSDHILEGVVTNGAQEHFYLETQRCIAIPGEDNDVLLYSSTQGTASTQDLVSKVLGVKRKDVTVDVLRLGGGFGGKESSENWSCLAALAAYNTKKPVELILTRHEDMKWTGKRHPFETYYKVGFNKEGKILAYSVELNANGGAYADISVAIIERAMLHADNAYYIPNIKIIGRPCRTNLVPNTAFRGFGAPQGIFAIEYVMDKIAHKLNMDPIQIREINVYHDGQQAPYGQIVKEASGKELFERLKKNSNYEELKNETREFNKTHKFVKRGLGSVPVKFGISFTTSFLNQGSALVWIYADGSVSLTHGGIEMGQELNTKVAQVVAKELGISLARIRVESSNTKRIGNATPTAASSGTDINCNAALNAALQLKERLIILAGDMLKNKIGLEPDINTIVFENDTVFDRRTPDEKISFEELISSAFLNRIALGAHGFYKTPGISFDRPTGRGTPFYYWVYGCALVQIEVDILSGNSRLLKVYIVHESAKSLNTEIDKGQITGGFFQGFGWSTFEESTYDDKGRLMADTPSTYKIPTIKDLPELIDIDIVQNERKFVSVYGSKAIGEPPLIYGEAAYFAIKDAIESCSEYKYEADLGMPATPESVLKAIEKLNKNDN